MYLDIAVAIFLIFCIFRGDKRGFVLAFTSTFGWVISLVGGYFLKPEILAWIDENTTLRNDFTVKITEYFVSVMKGNAQGGGLSETAASLPESVIRALSSAAEKAYQATAVKIAEPVADMIISLLAFFAAVFAIKFVMYLIERIIRRLSDKDGAVSSINSMLGMLFNLIRGCIVSYIIILFMIMISLLGNFQPVLELLQDSFLVTVLLDSGLMPFSADIFTGEALLEAIL